MMFTEPELAMLKEMVMDRLDENLDDPFQGKEEYEKLQNDLADIYQKLGGDRSKLTEYLSYDPD